MSHIAGHWQDDGYNLAVGAARAPKIFGWLKPSKDDCEEPIEELDILFINNRGYRREEYSPNNLKDPSVRIGFHLFKIPFTDPDGKLLFELPIAYDIVDFKTHLKAEKDFIKKVKAVRDLKKYSKNGSPIEAYSAAVIEKVGATFKNGITKLIVSQTAEFVQTPVFKNMKKSRESLQKAFEAGKLLTLFDFCEIRKKGTIILK